MSVGYPDYARLSQQGGQQLLNITNASPAYFTFLVMAYVGLWPYVNMFTNVAASTDFQLITLGWYTDHTFATQVSQRNAIRTGGSQGWTQYANQTDWLGVYYTTKSGLAIPYTQWSVFATTGPAEQIQLADNSGPITVTDNTLAASSSLTWNFNAIQPGDGLLTWDTTAASWEVDVNFYNWNLAAFQRQQTLKSGAFQPQGALEVPALDTPSQLVLKNNDTASRVLNVSWFSR